MKIHWDERANDFLKRSAERSIYLRSEDKSMAASCLKARVPNFPHPILATITLLIFHIY